MSWIKNVVVDLAVTLLIALVAAFGLYWAEVVVWIYTPLMLALKVFALFAGRLTALSKGRGAAEPPPWFFHVLYALNVVLLLIGARWLLAAGWAVIWALSAVQEARQRQKVLGE